MRKTRTTVGWSGRKATRAILASLSANPIQIQHRHKLFRRMVANKDKPALSLASWPIILESDHAFRRYWNRDLCAMSVAGMSPLEREIITAWCSHNGATRVSRMRTFDDFMHKDARAGIINIPDDLHDITYMENEMVVVGTEAFIRKALRFTQRLPMRQHTCYLRGMEPKLIRSELRGTNYRIVENISDPGSHIVSCDDRERLFPLWLRG